MSPSLALASPSTPKPSRRRRCLLGLAGWLLAAGLRLLRVTWRFCVVGRCPPGPSLLAFWHGDQIALLGARARRRVVVLVSRSKDGELAAVAARRLGFAVVRGSSSRGAVPAALGVIRRLRRGETAAIAVDGPRGPARRTGDDPLRLARCARVPVVPVVALTRHGMTLRSWDRLLVPAPFATVVVVWGEAVQAEGLQQAMEHTRRRALALVGRGGEAVNVT